MKGMKLFVPLLTAVALLGLASCGPDQSSSSSSAGVSTTGPIAKVKLAENTGGTTKYLESVSYERTSTAHVFYVKTTLVASNYMDALRTVNSNVGNVYTSISNSGDIWGPILIAIDRGDLDATTSGAAKFGNVTVETADTNFQFDALIRVNSSWDKPNITDGVPVSAENGTVYYEYLGAAGPTTGGSYWELSDREELKFQAADNDTDGPKTKFLSGSYSTKVDSQGASNRIDAAYFKYDSSTGEYSFTIPFSLIGKTQLKKVAVFGVANSGWRPGCSLNAVVKPLGSSKVFLQVDGSGVAGKIPVINVPQSSSESPSVTALVQKDALSLSVSEYAMGTTSLTQTVTLISATGAATATITASGAGSTNFTIPIKETNANGDYIYEGNLAFSAGTNGSSADFESDTNFTLTFTSASSGSASMNVLVVAPDFTVDALKDSVWDTAPATDDSADDASLSGGWGTALSSLMVTNDSTKLYVALDLLGLDNQFRQLVIYIDHNTNGQISTFSNAPGGALFDNPEGVSCVNFTPDTAVRIYNGADGSFTGDFVVKTITTNVTANTNATVAIGVDAPTGAGDTGFAEMSILLSDLGVSAGDTIKIAASHGHDWSGGYNVMDVVPGGYATANSTPLTITNGMSYVIK